MARTSKSLQPLDSAIVAILSTRIEESGATRRALAEETGMSANRVGIILRGEQPPATVGEVGALARVVGMTAGEIIAMAESMLDVSQADVALAAHDDLPGESQRETVESYMDEA